MSEEKTKTTYLVKGTNIRLDGKTYRIGRRIELTDEDAVRLKDFLETLDAEAAEVDQAYASFNEAMDAAMAKINELTEVNRTLFLENDKNVGIVQERDNTIIELVTKAAASDEAIKTLSGSLAERDKTIEKLNNQIVKLKEALTKKEGGKK